MKGIRRFEFLSRLVSLVIWLGTWAKPARRQFGHDAALTALFEVLKLPTTKCEAIKL